MATQKYIGARYMPKFVGTYDATTEYEALSVVDNGAGTTYVANKPVPAGTPLNYTEYWSVYGASSGAILDLQSRMQQAEGDIVDLTRDVANAGHGFVDQDSGAIKEIVESNSFVEQLYDLLYPNTPIAKYGIGFNTLTVPEAPANTPTSVLCVALEMNEATSDGVGLWVAVEGNTPGSKVFGANIIATCTEESKLVGIEIDYEPKEGVTPTGGNVYISNVFNSSCSGSHILLGGVNGGSMGDGVTISSGVRQTGIVGGSNLNCQRFMDFSNATFLDVAINHGSGLSQASAYKLTDGRSFIYSSGNDLMLVNGSSGASGAIVFKTGNENHFAVYQSGVIGVLNSATYSSANAGSAALPSNPVGFIPFNVNGTNYKIPYYG